MAKRTFRIIVKYWDQRAESCCISYGPAALAFRWCSGRREGLWLSYRQASLFPVSLVDLLTFVLQMSCASWTLLNLLAEHGWFTCPKIAGAYSQASPVAGFGTATVQWLEQFCYVSVPCPGRRLSSVYGHNMIWHVREMLGNAIRHF